MDYKIGVIFLILSSLLNGICEGRAPRKLELKDKWMKLAQNELKTVLSKYENHGVAKNVILFVGDGMGLTTTTMMRIHQGQLKGNSGEEEWLNFEKFPSIGFAKTYNTDKQVADSAGTATAFLCGAKTRWSVVGLDDSVTLGDCSSMTEASELTSILDWSVAEGKSGGVVTNTRITHATPASAYAKSAHRDWEDDSKLFANATKCKDIALQLYERGKNIQVILGGGRRGFMPNTAADPEYPTKKGNRKDGRNLIQEWEKDKKDRKFNPTYVWNKAEFDKVDPQTTDFLLGLFEPSHMKYEVDRVSKGEDNATEPSLAQMTKKAIQVLQKNKKGYFLVVEGGRIDHAHHDGKARLAVEEGMAFVEAVQQAIELTDTRDTLLVVTADHSHVVTLGGYTDRGNPLWGFGDGIIEKILDGIPYTSVLYANGPGFNVSKNGTRANPKLQNTSGLHYLQQTAVPMLYETHGGEDVTIYARGPMSHLFPGIHEQSYIAHAMGYASCVGPNKDHCEKVRSVNIGPGLRCQVVGNTASKNSGPNTGTIVVYLFDILLLLYPLYIHLK